MSQQGMEFVKKEYDKAVKENHPKAKYLKKILDDPTNKTNVLKNGLLAHCMECSHDPQDPAGSHPKKCSVKDCPLFAHRPMSGTEKAEIKAAKKSGKEVDPEKEAELKAKRQANAEKARSGRKMKFSEALEALHECGKDCKCKKKKKKDEEEDCKCKMKEEVEILDEANVTTLNKGGKKVLYSYKTPVAVKDGDTVYVTDTKHSSTTSKHISKFVDGADTETKKQSWFDKQFGTLD